VQKALRGVSYIDVSDRHALPASGGAGYDAHITPRHAEGLRQEPDEQFIRSAIDRGRLQSDPDRIAVQPDDLRPGCTRLDLDAEDHAIRCRSDRTHCHRDGGRYLRADSG
jgi:hypothetical protein